MADQKILKILLLNLSLLFIIASCSNSSKAEISEMESQTPIPETPTPTLVVVPTRTLPSMQLKVPTATKVPTEDSKVPTKSSIQVIEPHEKVNALSVPPEFPEITIVDHFYFEDFVSSQLVDYRTEEDYIVFDESSWEIFSDEFLTRFPEGTGIIMKFQIDDLAKIRVYFDSISEGGPYIRWGTVLAYTPYISYVENSERIQAYNFYGTTRLKSDHWYYLSMVIDNQKDFAITIWDSENENDYLFHNLAVFPSWENHEWSLVVSPKSGTLRVNEIIVYTVQNTSEQRNE